MSNSQPVVVAEEKPCELKLPKRKRARRKRRMSMYVTSLNHLKRAKRKPSLGALDSVPSGSSPMWKRSRSSTRLRGKKGWRKDVTKSLDQILELTTSSSQLDAIAEENVNELAATSSQPVVVSGKNENELPATSSQPIVVSEKNVNELPATRSQPVVVSKKNVNESRATLAAEVGRVSPEKKLKDSDKMIKPLDFEQNDGWVTYTVGGKPFEIARRTVMKFPDTLLAKMISGEFDKSDLRIDRDPTRFRYILNWFRDGRMILPLNIAKEEMITEITYYNLPVSVSDINHASFPHISALSDFQKHIQEVVKHSCDKFESRIDGLICKLLSWEREISHLHHASQVALTVARDLKRQFRDRKSLCAKGFKTSCRLPEAKGSSFRNRAEVELALEKVTNTKKNILDSGLCNSGIFFEMINRPMKKYNIKVVGINKEGIVKYKIVRPS